MTFESREESLQDARPSELIQITVAGIDYFFVNGEIGYIRGPDTYVPVPIRRSQPMVGQDTPGSEMQIELPTNHPLTQSLARSWVSASPETRTSRVEITKNHIGDAGYQPFWIGSIVSTSYQQDGTVTRFLCRALNNLFTLQGPRRNWGTLCTHQHFDRFCTLTEATYLQSGTITALDSTGTVYTIPGLSAAQVRWNAGEMRKPLTFSSRMIIDQSGDDFTVQYPIPEIAVGDTVEIIEGCSHDTTDCVAYTNILNFGGIPYTPDINPFTSQRGLKDL